MSLCSQFQLLAAYNAWMNTRLFEACARLDQAAFEAERGAFFGSLAGTLKHLVAGDTIWLGRFAAHPAPLRALDPVRALAPPASLDAMVSADLVALFAQRRLLDDVISELAGELTEADLAHVLVYTNTRGVVSQKLFSNLLLHFFNHQTHHRGQATTLLSQAQIHVGVTDLLALVPNVDP